ncbi:MAG: SDR family NAD(P)-dependent oxidoreductase [Limnohabitans sp.]
MSHRKRTIVVGATSAMAVHCMRLWAERGDTDFVLIGRDAVRLDHVRQDLQTRFTPLDVTTLALDLTDPQAVSKTVRHIAQAGPIDRVLIAHGSLPDQQACEQDLGLLHETLMVNGVSPVLFAQAFALPMAMQSHPSVLCVIGSVAGDRGRKSNAFYGAAKSMVSTCLQGLQHRHAGTPLQCVLIKPGPTRTPMTQGLDMPDSRLASVESVSADIVQAMERGQAVRYTPAKWRWIMWMIRNMPAALFNKLNI